MINTYTHKKLTWIDLESPTKDEVINIMNQYKIHPLVAEELSTPNMKPKVELHKDFIYLVLHFPVIKHSHRKELGRSQEIDFIIGKHFIITTRYDNIDPLHEFSKIFEVNSILDKSHIGDHAGFIFYHMIKGIYRSTTDELEYVRDSLKRIETEVFSGNEHGMVFSISNVARELLNFKNTLSLHKDVLESFESAGRQFFKGDFDYYLRAITGEYYKIKSIIENEMEMMTELRETNNSLLTTKQNETIKKLSVLALVTFPISLIIGLFAIETVSRPIVGMKGDFWILALLFSLIAATLIIIFHQKKWL